MGAEYSYMNIWALATIMRITEADIDSIYEMYHAEQLNNGVDESSPDYYTIKEETIVKYLTNLTTSPEDIDVFLNLFRLIDVRGFRTVDIRDLLISVVVLTSSSVQHCLLRALLIIDDKKSGLIEKPDLFRIVRLLNDTCYYFGDKYLNIDQVHDLVNSTYTTAGKIDGTIYYPNFIEFISTHPIVELFLSPQFQGPVKNKVMSEEALEAFVNSER